MKTLTMFALVMVVLIMPCRLFAQQGQPQAPGAAPRTEMPPGHQRGGPDQHVMDRQREMMGEYDQMMKEMDARLQEKVAAMDAAKGDRKVEAMASVIKEMIAQRKEMRERMMKMRGMTMEHGHDHMGMGDRKPEAQ